MIRKAFLALSTAAVLASFAWLIATPGYEPAVALLAGLAGILSSLPPESRPVSDRTEEVSFSKPEKAFDSEFWPEEGVPQFEAATSHFTLHVHPSHSAPVAMEMKASPGSAIDFSAFRYRTTRPGKVVAKTSGTLVGRNLGEIDYLSREMYYGVYTEEVELPYNHGDAFEYLQYRAEGSCFIRHDRRVVEIEYCPWLGSSDKLALTKQPASESWLHVLDKAGVAQGWLCAERGVVEEVGRSF